MKVFHGTDQRLNHLQRGTYVTKNIRDAWKFGFRRAYESSSPNVFIYSFDVDPKNLSKDPNRDRAYLLVRPVGTFIIAVHKTYEVPYKLRLYP